MAEKSVLKKRVMEGVVVSDKMQKTVVVKVERRLLHPVYKKTVKKYKKFKVHDPKEEAKTGDRVLIIESRPFSKDKKFCLFKVVK